MISGRTRFPRRLLAIAAICLSLSALGSALAAQPAAPCSSTVTAQVVALDSAIFANRMGAQLPDAMIFALAGDVQPTDGASPADWTTWTAGNVELKGYKRPRPLVLRVNAGQCLRVQFRNLVSTTAGSQPTTRATSLHIQGMNWVDGADDDGSWVGANASSLSNPGDPVRTYDLYAPEEGPFLLYSTGDVSSANAGAGAGSVGGDGGQLQQGLFGALNVEPEGSEQYRSQVNHEDLCLATVGSTWQNKTCTAPAGAPKIDYQATYPAGHPRAGLPVLRMTQTTPNGTFLVHSDLTAIISGPNAGPFTSTTAPGLSDTPTSPDRQEPFREFTIIYHEMLRTQQAFSDLYAAPQLGSLLESANDNFAINYGMGGIGSEILANRLGRGPAGDCLDCKYEEFFLSSWTNGDPAMVVDVNADAGCEIPEGSTDGYPSFACPQATPATRAYYPDDPSNVYHSYLWDHTRFRILHGGSDLHHIHHLHAHQWLHSPNSSSGHYLDSQAIGPGAAFTLEMVYNGSGNKNLTVGDSIFHCHFYPHFAAGMWSLWRVHDVFEAGTQLDGYPGGRPAQNSRALPDGEIVTGTPIPGLVPISTNALPPPPAPVRLTQSGTVAEVCTDGSFSTCVSALSTQGDPADFQNPGYPFFIPGMAGSRSPHPPMDFALACSNSGAACDTAGSSCGAGGTCQAIDGGLPRHIVQAETQVNKFASPAPADPNVATPALNPLDFSKEVLQANGIGLPEQGTVVEQVAMQYHARRTHSSQTPGGQPADFVTNGRPPRPGAPYADPCIDIEGTVPAGLRNLDYWGVDFQTDAVFNKEGWHFPQQRMIALWGDLFDFLGLNGGQKKAPEPFFIRANSNDCVHYRLANLIPKTFELDDFQVRTPTDILGQHIHLVKFDVTSSDGGANGFNYEDGTLAPDEVVERINAFNNGSWKANIDAQPSTTPLTPSFIKFFGADPSCAQNPDSPACQCQVVQYEENGHTKQGVKGGHWCGAQATVQTWYVDPTLNNAGQDLTLRTVFTHDHFGPSTHQQAGVYAALVSEPQGSTWHDNQTGDPLGGRTASQNGVSLQDGGPTSWQAVIRTTSQPDSFREFLFAMQDSTLMYRPFPASVKPPACPAGTATCGFCSTEPAKACSLDPTSPIYWETVCTKVGSLPNPKNLRNSTQGLFAPTQLQPSCNFVPGIPSRNSLFFQTASGPNPPSNNPGNIWGGVNADLATLGWDTMPISPSPNGVFVAGTQNNPAQPEAITLDGATTNFSVNYRNEPIYPRLYSNGATTAQDLATVYQSIPRTLPGAVAPPYAPLTAGVGANDPFTPLLRANAGDNVQVRMVVGAHQNPHNFMLHGNKWLYEPSNVNSGWRASQTMGISEHFEFLFRVPGPWTPPTGQSALAATDYLYRPTSAKLGQMSGSWGLLRAYNAPQADLFPVPGAQAPAPVPVCPAALMSAQCGANDGQGHTLRCYDVVAARIQDAFKTTGKPLVLNSKLGWEAPNAVLYFLADDYAKLQAGQAVPGINPATGLAEPLVLRAAAGDCIKVNLKNDIPANTALGQGFASRQLPVDGAAGQPASSRGLYVPSSTSTSVGLHPQLVAYDAARGDGMNVGNNPAQTAAPGQSVTYWWYAGAVDGSDYIPVEFGAANLLPADPINHHPYNLFAALVIEPEGATWQTDPNSRASATVTAGSLTFREQVLVMQDDGVLFTSSGVRQAGGASGGFNLRTEPLTGQSFRQCANTADSSCVFSNQALCSGSACGDPQTPVFCAQAGQEARIRLLHPGGAVTNNIFEVFGHTFAEEPYTTAAANCQAPTTHANVNASGVIRVGNQCPDGTVAVGPSLTEWKGSRNGHGPGNHFDVVIQKAGGQNGVAGDYLYRSFPAPHVNSGIWGLLRVTPGAPTGANCPSFTTPGT